MKTIGQTNLKQINNDKFWKKLMESHVKEYWHVIVNCGYEDCDLLDQYNLIETYLCECDKD
jgi:hypothetical protein